MAENWKTLKTTEVAAGGQNFIEITLKQPPEGNNKFIGISKGWRTEHGEKRYKTNILFAEDKKDEIIKAIQEIN